MPQRISEFWSEPARSGHQQEPEGLFIAKIKTKQRRICGLSKGWRSMWYPMGDNIGGDEGKIRGTLHVRFRPYFVEKLPLIF